ncbi:expressed unknown protein [Seminavis robusta]|uniref:Uncharacterized protein n=1 Tax=Seminavis robusta TaxID=568900 RepID=A0A9N8DEF6_9STRA|nr:expressed unknown protein [Seminavis robusta]|eukprot:Sro84_g044890.1 n/a (143) ;mRNA; f:73980-74408
MATSRSQSQSAAIPFISVSAIIHVLPLPGILGASALERLYGIRFSERSVGGDTDNTSSATLLIALQHRAAMFGTLGAGLILGTFYHRPSLPVAIGMTLVSDVSFLALTMPKWKNLNSKMKRVAFADIVSIVCLVVGYPQIMS